MNKNNLLILTQQSLSNSYDLGQIPKSPSVAKAQNQLLVTARKIFLKITKLRTGKKIKDADKLRSALAQDLEHFQQELQGRKSIDADVILISRYILCALLDEVVDDVVVKQQLLWDHPSFLEEFYKEGYADENFFIILDRVSQAPHQYLELLELMYVCLSLGYEGRFKKQVGLQSQLQKIIEHTYQLIRSQRGEINKNLSPTVEAKMQESSSTSSLEGKRFPFLRIMLCLFALVLILDILFNYLLQVCSSPLLQQMHQALEILIR